MDPVAVSARTARRRAGHRHHAISVAPARATASRRGFNVLVV
ncbi:hypothetical protein P355_4346 [Burkholderia cenocepacia KC-01]|nr:hypothetical protein P355_4346 [Burkholderia cenocepacia KC-01]